MTISTGDILGHSQVGVYLSVVGNNLFYPTSLDKPAIEEIQQVFDIEMNPLLIGGSALLGSLICGNNKGIAVADIATEADLDILSSYGDIVILESGVNAAGNLLECNDFGAVVSKSIPNPGVELIGEILGVNTARVRVAGQDTVGSLLVANNKGILSHPDITSYEVKEIEKTMQVPVMVGTVCFGSPYVGAGCVTSDTNALVGSGSTGPELNRIEDALGLI
ncbi:translation initiation factor IF-6 [Euryarchaeota archaeon]|nr:translation initiation factor IF-6 [Candidatus Thalassarchaeum sp.]MDB3854842.1 translation initiation factor IF-6 [Euryarchaeota archaeon]MDB4865482.1 translation initiation factor IF-6 [Euryarchaeota archaeon]MDC3247049.1 translation initiation factor IF-6 [Euryarchaeota archaeon]MDC3281679.1 translation initiation factor IF-6 [Euryarchaeota archaeon]